MNEIMISIWNKLVEAYQDNETIVGDQIDEIIGLTEEEREYLFYFGREGEIR